MDAFDFEMNGTDWDDDFMDIMKLIPSNCFQEGNETNNTGEGCDLSAIGKGYQGEFDCLKEIPYQVFVIFLYSVVVLFGALGNTLVVITIIKTKQLWNATNIFIANLAVADIFVCVFDLPLSLYYAIKGEWVFGKALCHVIPSAFGVVVFASTLTLTMIAIDRFILIIFPLKKRMTNVTVLVLVLLIAILSAAAAAPIARYSVYRHHEQDADLGVSHKICMEEWPSPLTRRIYTCTMLAVQFIIPLTLILVLYVLIFFRLRTRLAGNKNCKKTKTTKMLVAVVTVFAISWVPFHTFSIITEFKPDFVSGRYYKFIDVVLKVIAMSSSCINPILYGWLNDNYRNAFLSIIKRPNTKPKGIHREESECSTRRDTTKKGSAKKMYQKLATNGKVKATEPTDEAVPLQTVSSSTADPVVNTNNNPAAVKDNDNNCNSHTCQTPLLK